MNFTIFSGIVSKAKNKKREFIQTTVVTYTAINDCTNTAVISQFKKFHYNYIIK